MKKTIDMTQGNPLLLLIRFALPLMLGSFFQQLYSFADTAIVGRGISVDALSAVGVTGSLNMVILGFTMGAAIGFTVLISQSVGGRRQEDISRYFWNGLYVAAAMGLLVSVCVTPFVRPLLVMMNTPAELMDMAVEYLSVIVAGSLASVLYNYFAAVIRAFGDSRRPFYFLLISSVCNVGLDLLFILVFRMGVAGAAIATVISQILSAVLCCWWLFGKLKTVERRGESGSYQKLSLPHIRKMCSVGLPLGLESSVTSIGFLLLQSSINTLGAVAAAAQVCGEKIRHIATIPCDSLGTAMSTYVGQNYGAKRIGRIEEGVKGGMLIQAVVCITTWALLAVLDEPLVYLLLGEKASAEALGAIQYLNIVAPLFLLQGTMKVLRGVPQGMGHGLLAMGSGAVEVVGRVVGGMLAVSCGSFTLICLSNPLAWGLAMIYCAFVARYCIRKKQPRSAAPEAL